MADTSTTGSGLPQSSKPPYTGSRFNFSHSQLGELTGRSIENARFLASPVVQFRSIPYATIPARFRPPIPLDNIPADFDKRPHRDFTNFGAACPSVGAKLPEWSAPWGGPLEDDKNLEFDEFTCLTVTVSVPESQLGAAHGGKKLPVMVYIHGGGFSDGVGHVDGLHSNAPLASYAASIEQPVVTVNIGYRLNWFGGIVCQDILDEYTASPTSPKGPFNLALQDQRVAFAWIKKYIGGFGGDSSQICAFAESAGSIFLAYHICGSSEPLFKRAILQSGLVATDVPFEEKDKEYQDLLKSLSIEENKGANRLKALREVDSSVLASIPGSHMTHFLGNIPGVKMEDSLFTRGSPASNKYKDLLLNCDWLGDLIIGDDFWEGFIFAGSPLRLCSISSFTELVKSIFPSQHADNLLSAYKIPNPTDPDDKSAWIPMSHILGDMIFSTEYDALSHAIVASNNPRKVYRYHFGFSNPCPGPGNPLSGVVGHHFVEILFIFLTLLDRYPTDRDHWLEKQACETARRWIAFANAQEPWPCFAAPGVEQMHEAKIAICDDSVGWAVRSLKEDEEVSQKDPWRERRYAAWRVFAGAWAALKGPGDDEDAHDRKVNNAKLKLLQLGFGPTLMRVPGRSHVN